MTTCDDACLRVTGALRRPVRPGDAPLPVVGHPTVLVPLDGTPGSEAALPAARTLAREQGARVRLLRVMPVTGTVRDADEQVVAYSDQESARDEYAARWYLQSLRPELAECQIEEVVRFGDPAAEILREAEQPDVAVIAMAARPRWGLASWFRRSVSRRVEREAWVPVRRARYGATT
jgi:nucleotide-binding universal stress UspA family protein